MKKALLIAEKPSLRRTIEDVYDKHRKEIPYEITFLEQRGHLLTLKDPAELSENLKKWSWDTLPIVPEDYGGFKYKVIPEKKTGNFLTSKERFEKIRSELSSGKYDFVIHAGDPDQEGELLVNIVLRSLKNTLPVKRYWSNDTTEGKVLEALLHLRDESTDDVLKHILSAAYARQRSDYRFGMNISRAATLKLGIRASCGRVKTPILSLVCRREDEIKNFKPKTVYGVKVTYEGGSTGQLYEAASTETDAAEKEEEKDKGLIWFETKEEAESIIKSLPGKAEVVSFQDKEKKTSAPKLYKLATAQIAAGKLGFSSNETLGIIQSLYEKGFLTYPRTDCEFISSGEDLAAALRSVSSVPDLSPYANKVTPEAIERVRKDKKYVNDKKLLESGHSALSPTGKAPDFEKLSEDEKKIYRLIARDFLAIFLPPERAAIQTMITKAGNHTFKSTGRKVIDPGFTVLFEKKDGGSGLTPHKEGEELPIAKKDIAEKTSICPKHYTDAELIAVCEAPHKYLYDSSLKSLGKNLKIGTPATRSSIIEELITRDGYLKRAKEKKIEIILPTEKGRAIYDNLKDLLICKVDMTGLWEEKLESIREGKTTLSAVEDEMKADVAAMVEEIKSSSIESVSEKPLGTCPNCGREILSGRFGPYCSGKCGFFPGKAFGKTLSDEEVASLLSGNEVHLTGLKSKKTGKKYSMFIKATGITGFTYKGKDGKDHEGKTFQFETRF